jgi:hypothetical protein
VNDDLAAFKKEKKAESKDCSERYVYLVGLPFFLFLSPLFGKTISCESHSAQRSILPGMKASPRILK